MKKCLKLFYIYYHILEHLLASVYSCAPAQTPAPNDTTSWMFRFHLCTVKTDGDVSSIFIYVNERDI